MLRAIALSAFTALGAPAVAFDDTPYCDDGAAAFFEDDRYKDGWRSVGVSVGADDSFYDAMLFTKCASEVFLIVRRTEVAPNLRDARAAFVAAFVSEEAETLADLGDELAERGFRTELRDTRTNRCVCAGES